MVLVVARLFRRLAIAPWETVSEHPSVQFAGNSPLLLSDP